MENKKLHEMLPSPSYFDYCPADTPPEERKRHAQKIFRDNAFRGAAMFGSLGVVGHFLAQWKLPVWQRAHKGMKVFLVSSTFVLGFWIVGETAYDEWKSGQRKIDLAASKLELGYSMEEAWR